MIRSLVSTLSRSGRRSGLVVAGIAIAPVLAAAHGPQMQVTVDNGKIVTREVLIDVYQPLSPPKSAYIMPVKIVDDFDFGPSWRATPDENPANPFGPGIAYGLGATFPTNSTITLTALAGLELWTGSSFVDAGATELAMLRTSNPNGASLAGNAGFTGGADPSAEASIGASYTEDAHSSVTYVLLGDGVSPALLVADGVYRATFMLSSSDPTIRPSDPYYFLLVKGSDAPLAAAVESLGLDPARVQYLGVPEPASAAVAALAATPLLSARRRREERA